MFLSARKRRCRTRRRGSAAVEFALVAPVFFLTVLGMVEVGRALMVQHVLTNAVRDGARTAILDGATAQSVQSQVEQFLAAGAVPGANVTVSPNPLSSASIGDPVSVTAAVPFDNVSWLPSGFFLGGQTLSATVVMRRESGTTYQD